MIRILFGSQTGCARAVAERIARECALRGVDPVVEAMDEYDRTRLPREERLVFVASTTGQGEVPDNMRNFWTALRVRGLPADLLSNLSVAVFGLGDSSYPLYNAVARRLHRRLLNLGARELCPRGLGNDQEARGYDEALEPWLDSLWNALGVPRKVSAVALPPSVYAVRQTDEKKEQVEVRERCTVVENRRLTAPDHDQDVRHIDFACALPYRPGDVLLVRPRNGEDAARAFATRVGVDPSATLSITYTDAQGAYRFCVGRKSEVPTHTTALELFCGYLDFQGVPDRFFFEAAAYFTDNDMHRERLLEFASAEGQDELHKYCMRERRSFLEVLVDFPSVSIPLPYLLELIPRIQPRQFSIASSPTAHAGHVHLTVAVVNYKTPMGRPRSGLCSSFLARLSVGDRLGDVWVHASPVAPARSTICIGAGTGIAPFRSLAHELSAHDDNKPERGRLLLFAGHRYRARDFLYGEEWAQLSAVTQVVTAFSREDHVYVQDRMREHAQTLRDWLGPPHHANVFVAGNKDLPAGVREALEHVLDDVALVKKLYHAIGRIRVEAY